MDHRRVSDPRVRGARTAPRPSRDHRRPPDLRPTGLAPLLSDAVTGKDVDPAEVTPATIGVVGAGQLGRMLHQAAIGPGLRLRFLAASADDCTVAVHPGHDLGSALDPAALAAFATTVDVVSFEHEV